MIIDRKTISWKNLCKNVIQKIFKFQNHCKKRFNISNVNLEEFKHIIVKTKDLKFVAKKNYKYSVPWLKLSDDTFNFVKFKMAQKSSLIIIIFFKRKTRFYANNRFFFLCQHFFLFAYCSPWYRKLANFCDQLLFLRSAQNNICTQAKLVW